MSIKIHVHKPGSARIQALEIAEEILIAELLQQILDGQHEQFDLFHDGRPEPHHRHHSAKEAGIKNGDHLHCHPKVREITVHIDRVPYKSPSTTTGSALYQLGNVAPGHQLYLEVEGRKEDEPIFKDGEIFHLKEDAKFYSSDIQFKGFDIIVNTEPKPVFHRLFSYDEVVALAALPTPTGADPEMTVGYEEADCRPEDGTLTPGHFVKVKNGTILHVTPTNRS